MVTSNPFRDADRTRRERGSQTAEFALVTPLVFMLLAMVVAAGLVGVEIVQAQHIARETARAAAVSPDDAARAVGDQLAGPRPLQTAISPATGARQVGDLVTADIQLRSGIAERFALEVWLPARSVMRTEDVP